MERRPEPGSPLEDAAFSDTPEIDVTSGRAVASESWGTTADEQRSGEPLDLRLAHEEPELDDGLVVRPVGHDGEELTAEEAAMHVIDEPTAGA